MGSNKFEVQLASGLQGTATVPGDKSISHRAVMFSALASGVSHVRGWLAAGDTEASLRCVQALGVRVERHNAHEMTIHGTGQLQPANDPLNFSHAGTGIRLMAGVMAGQPFASVLDGSAQLRRRPMRRIIAPLHEMGADISGHEDRAPLTVNPAHLRGVEYVMPVASAQVKSAILLAALFAEGETVVIQPGPARDHTERMLKAMNVDLTTEGDRVILRPRNVLQPVDFSVPGDFSSVAFPLVAGCVVPDSDLMLTDINLNETRTGLLDVLLEMGADIEVLNLHDEAGEPAGNLHVRFSALKGIEIGGDVVVRMIDEFPVFMVAALQAEGRTIVRDAAELRVKETDRLAVMTAELRKMGAVITETEDGFIIDGPQQLQAATVESHDDHRIAMSMTVAGLVAQGQSTINDTRCAGDSFPGFAQTMQGLGAPLLEIVAPV